VSSTGERSTPCRPGTSSLHVVSSDPDAVLERALKIDATIVHPLVDQTDYPSRDFTVAGPDGNHWTFGIFSKTPVFQGLLESTPSRIRTGDFLRERCAAADVGRI
jgi:hypothetical protein